MVQYVNISLCAGNFYKNDFIEPELLLSAIVKKGGQNIVELGFSLKTGILKIVKSKICTPTLYR